MVATSERLGQLVAPLGREAVLAQCLVLGLKLGAFGGVIRQAKAAGTTERVARQLGEPVDVLLGQLPERACPIGAELRPRGVVWGRAATVGEAVRNLGRHCPALQGSVLDGDSVHPAYKLSLNGKEAPVIDGLTGDQRFFMAWAQVWRSKYRDEALVNLIKTNPHSPPAYRINGPVRNLSCQAYAATSK